MAKAALSVVFTFLERTYVFFFSHFLICLVEIALHYTD